MKFNKTINEHVKQKIISVEPIIQGLRGSVYSTVGYKIYTPTDDTIWRSVGGLVISKLKTYEFQRSPRL